MKYSQFLQNTVDSLSGMKVALDGANGATASMLTRLFADLDTDFHTMGDKPNGVNINDGVGSTHPEALVAFVKETGADLGLSSMATATAVSQWMKMEKSLMAIKSCSSW